MQAALVASLLLGPIQDNNFNLKSLHGIGQGYLRDHASLITLVCPLDLAEKYAVDTIS